MFLRFSKFKKIHTESYIRPNIATKFRNNANRVHIFSPEFSGYSCYLEEETFVEEGGEVQVCAPITGSHSPFFLILSTGRVSPKEPWADGDA